MPDRIASIAESLVAARKAGARIALKDAPQSLEEGFAVQEKVVAGLGSPVIGWKVIPHPSGSTMFAPLLASGSVPAGGTWKLTGKEPAGIELEIAFKMGRDVPAGATQAQILDCIEAAHVVFELCQSRLVNPDDQPQHVKLADSILNAGITLGPKFDGWRTRDLKGIPGRLLVDGRVHKEGKSVDPIGAISALAPALTSRGKTLAKGQTVITGSLIGMNWLTGRHALTGVIDGCGEVAITLEAA